MPGREIVRISGARVRLEKRADDAPRAKPENFALPLELDRVAIFHALGASGFELRCCSCYQNVENDVKVLRAFF
jgi:hypothetical protein